MRASTGVDIADIVHKIASDIYNFFLSIIVKASQQYFSKKGKIVEVFFIILQNITEVGKSFF
jgi:hypothetical protein